MKTIAAAIAIVALCVWSNAALANWQYTRWGMSVEGVEAASGGNARTLSQQEADGWSPTDHSLQARLAAPYRTGPFTFEAVFLFDDANKLARVDLQLKNGNPLSLIGSLHTKYGKPANETSSSEMTNAIWYVGTEMIWVTMIGPVGDTRTSVTYRPRLNADNSGL